MSFTDIEPLGQLRQAKPCFIVFFDIFNDGFCEDGTVVIVFGRAILFLCCMGKKKIPDFKKPGFDQQFKTGLLMGKCPADFLKKPKYLPGSGGF